MRYTSEATMDEKGLRDVERWKDKIEVRLDNRQVAFLFFGSALIACLLFILGVIVGKRIESRGHAVAPEIEDPLALLDRVASTERAGADATTLPRALVGLAAKGRAAASPLSATPASKKIAAPVVHAASPAAESIGAGAKILDSAIVAAARPSATKGAAVAPSVAPSLLKPVKAAVTTTTATPTGATPTGATPTGATPTGATPPPAAAVSSEISAPAAAATLPGPTPVTRGKGRYALQIRAFPDRGEADAFAKRFVGHTVYVTPAQIPGQGTWFRVRVGDYGTFKEAVGAKASFEKQFSVIGLVVGPLL